MVEKEKHRIKNKYLFIFPDNKFNQMSLMLSDDFLNELREEKIINEDDLLDIPAFLRRQAR